MFILLTFTHTCKCVQHKFCFAVANLSTLSPWLCQQVFIYICILCRHTSPVHVQIFSLYARFMFHAQRNRWKSVCVQSFKDHYVIQDYRCCTKPEKKIGHWDCSPDIAVTFFLWGKKRNCKRVKRQKNHLISAVNQSQQPRTCLSTGEHGQDLCRLGM